MVILIDSKTICCNNWLWATCIEINPIRVYAYKNARGLKEKGRILSNCLCKITETKVKRKNYDQEKNIKQFDRCQSMTRQVAREYNKKALQNHALTPSNRNKDIMYLFPNIVPIDQFTGLYFSHRWSVRTLQKPGWCFITFRELSKIISRKYTMPAITLMVKISSGDFAHVSKALLWAHVQSFSLKP